MKAVGCFGVFLFFTAVGMYVSSQFGKRVRQLKNLEKAVVSMKREIDYQLSPLGEALLHAGKRTEPPWNQFFTQAGEKFLDKKRGLCEPDEVFQEEIKKIRFYHPWEKDLDILLALSKGLGELDKKMQLVQLSMAEEEIRQAVGEAEQELEKKGKLYQTLGACMGVLGVILLI